MLEANINGKTNAEADTEADAKTSAKNKVEDRASVKTIPEIKADADHDVENECKVHHNVESVIEMIS